MIGDDRGESFANHATIKSAALLKVDFIWYSLRSHIPYVMYLYIPRKCFAQPTLSRP